MASIQSIILLIYFVTLVKGCEDKLEHCSHWQKAGYCKPSSVYFKLVKGYCPKTCGYCPTPPPPKITCNDKSHWCSSYKDYCKVQSYRDYLITNCANTCNFCYITTKPPPTTTTIATQPFTGAGGRDIQPGCGKKSAGHTRVVGGTNAKPGDWPWQVNIDFTENTHNPGHWCGGTLITEDWVVSAAHCFDDRAKDKYTVKLGEHDLRSNSSWEQRFEVAELIIHPKYNANGYTSDIALIRLKGNATLNNRVRTACLPGRNTNFPSGSKCYISGWGLLKDYGDYPVILQQASVPLAEHSECRRAFQRLKHKITGTMLCAGDGKGFIDACGGDSGGPLVCKHRDKVLGEDVWFLWGAISWGVGCARKGLYGVYTDIKVMRPWIDEIVFK